MDLIHYAKWGIHVKEEPDSLDTLQFKEAEESNVTEINGGWMCKFPCDAQAAFNVSIADSIPSGLQEPIEASLPSYSVDHPESLDSHPPAVSTLLGGTERVNVDCVSQLYSLLQEGEPAQLCTRVHVNANKNASVKSPPEHQSLANTDRQQLTNSDNAMILDDLSQREVISTNFGNIQENTIHLPNNKRLDECDETASNVGHNSNFELMGNACHEINSDENCENAEASSSSPDELSHKPNGICSLNNNIIKTNQINCLKQKSPRKSENAGFKCPDCNKVIRRSSGFMTHMKLHHMSPLQSEPVPVKCKHCAEVFLNRKSLFLHKKVCKYSKKNSLNSFNDDQDDTVSTSTKYMNEGVHENCLQYALLKDNKTEPSNPEGKIQEISENQLHWNPETNQKNSGKTQKIRRSSDSNSSSSRRRRSTTSSEKESELSLSSKKKRLSQSFKDFCSENVRAHNGEKGNNVIQEKWPKLKNLDYQDSWFSEIKSKEDEKIHSSKSIILSLRRFRFRRPKVLVTRAKIPNYEGKVSETKSVGSRVEDSCSINVNNTNIQLQEDADHDSVNKESSSECVTNELETISDCLKNIESDLALTRDSDPVSLLINHEFSQENDHSETCSKPLDNGKKPNPSNSLNKQYPNVEDIQEAVPISLTESQTVINSSPVSIGSNSFLRNLTEEDTTVNVLHDNESNKNVSKFSKKSKTHSNLKIRIKPVVVLNRLGLFENINKESYTSPKVTSKKYFKKAQKASKKACDQITVNVDSKESNIVESILLSGLHSNNQSILGDKSALNVQNLDNEDFIKSKNKPVSDNESSFAKKLNTSNTKCTLDKSKNKNQYDSKVPLEILEKQYCLKKCYVKLKRIEVEENNTVKCNSNFSENPRADGELRTCEKLKLHRTNSKSWEISSVKSCRFQNIIPVENSPPSDFKGVTKENNSMKKGPMSEVSSHVLSESFEMSHKNHRFTLKGRHIKRSETLCTSCGKTFYNKQEYAEHLKTHFEGYKCHKCSAKFHFWMELQNHLVGCSLVSFLHSQKDIPLKECQVILGKVRNK